MFLTHSAALIFVVNFLGITRTLLRVWSSFIRIIGCFIRIQILESYSKPFESESLKVEPMKLLREPFVLLCSLKLENHYPKSSKSLHRYKGNSRKTEVEKSMGEWHSNSPLPHHQLERKPLKLKHQNRLITRDLLASCCP